MKYSGNISAEEMERIEAFLDGSMSGQDRSQFEQELQSNPELQAKTEEIRLLQIGIQEALLQSKMSSFHQPAAKVVSMKSNSRRWLAAASIILLLAVGGWFFFSKKDINQQLYSNYFKPDPGLPTTMSSSDAYEFEKAMIDYKNGDYQKAINSWSTQPKNDTLNYFIGIAQQALGHTSEAIELLTPIANDSNRAFHKDACWYLGLALLNNKQNAKAISYIEKSTHPQKDALLTALKDLQ